MIRLFRRFLLLGLLFGWCVNAYLGGEILPETPIFEAKVTDDDRRVYAELVSKLYDSVQQFELGNGVTLACIPQSHTNKVVVSATYPVGTRHEAPHEFGLAHIVEHMIFKGTKKMREGDLDRIGSVFGIGISKGGLNASTGHDKTHFYFETDAQNYGTFIDVMADCAQNMDWDSSVLDSELAAIFQEIKLRGADARGGIEDWLGVWLPYNHPYAHRIIGYKEQIFKFTREEVLSFYKKHYRRVLITVVGNIDVAAVKEKVAQAFASFDGRDEPIFQEADAPLPFFNNNSQVHQVVYTPTQSYTYQYFWRGVCSNNPVSVALNYGLSVLSKRLNRELIDDKGLCVAARAWQLSLALDGIIAVTVVPRLDQTAVDYESVVRHHIEDIIMNGITDAEYAEVHRASLAGVVGIVETTKGLHDNIVNAIFSAGGLAESRALDDYVNRVTIDEIQKAIATYMRPFLMHTVKSIPLPAEEVASWQQLQGQTDLHEKTLLAMRERQITASTAEHADTLSLPVRNELDPAPAIVPDELFTLSNGIRVFYKHNALSPSVTCSLSLLDTEKNKLCLAGARKDIVQRMWQSLLIHGTQKHTKKQMDDAFDALGASCVVGANVGTSFLKQYGNEALSLVREMLEFPLFPDAILVREKASVRDNIVRAKSIPWGRIGFYLSDVISEGYPWYMTLEEQEQAAEDITREDVVAYHQFICGHPEKIVCTIVGDLSATEAKEMLESHIGNLRMESSAQFDQYVMPEFSVQANRPAPIKHIDMSAEEVAILAFRKAETLSGKSTPALMLLSDYINKKLFDIREKTGLFYSCHASIVIPSFRLPGVLSMVTTTGVSRASALIEALKGLLVDLSENGMSFADFEQIRGGLFHKLEIYSQTSGVEATTLSAAVNRPIYDENGAFDANASFAFDHQFTEKMKAVTHEEVNAVLREYFDPAEWSFVTAGRQWQSSNDDSVDVQ